MRPHLRECTPRQLIGLVVPAEGLRDAGTGVCSYGNLVAGAKIAVGALVVSPGPVSVGDVLEVG